MSKKLLNLKYHVLQKGAEFQTSGVRSVPLRQGRLGPRMSVLEFGICPPC